MKRITISRNWKISHFANKKWYKSLLRAKRKRNNVNEIGKKVLIGSNKYFELTLPAEMDFDNHKLPTLNFITDFRKLAILEQKRVRIDFTNLSSISPAASLVLVAEIYRCWKVSKKKVMATSISKCKVANYLDNIGFYALLDVRNPKIRHALPETEKAKIYLPFATEIKDNGQLADELKQKIIEQCPNSLPDNLREKIYRGMLESMSNVSRHAYDEKYANHIKYKYLDKRWWLSGYVDKANGDILIQFYDQGAGIPNTLLASKMEKVKHTLSFKSSPKASLIQAATQEGRSGTREHYRGKGLPEIVDAIKTSQKGKLSIISNEGEYKIFNEGGETKEELIDNNISLNGTLIQWRFEANK